MEHLHSADCTPVVGAQESAEASTAGLQALTSQRRHPDNDANSPECMTDIWREWDGLREVARQAEVGA